MQPNRYLITIGSPAVPNLEPLPCVKSDVEKIVQFFTSGEQGYQQVLSKEVPIGAKAGTIKKYVGKWFASSGRKPSDQVIIYVAGHAEDRFGRLDHPCLLLSDSHPNNPNTVIKLDEFTALLFDGVNERPNNVLLILDVCYANRLSGKAISTMTANASSVLEGGSGFHVIASSGADFEAYDGYFTEALFDVIQDEAWQPAREHFHIPDLVEGINQWFRNHGTVQAALYAAWGGKEADRFIRAEGKTILLPDITDFSYWNLKARGVDFAGNTDWFFTGRERALTEMAAWLNSKARRDSIYFVTGDPGSGKSALLGRIALSAFPATRELLIKGLSLGARDATLPPAGSIQVCFNAREMDEREVAIAIARQLNLKAVTVNELIEVLITAKKQCTILIDSLDESRTPSAVLQNLLLPLASANGVRLIIGSRRNYVPFDQPGISVIDLDNTGYFSSSDIGGYIEKRLTDIINIGKRISHFKRKALSTLASMVTEKAAHSFLYARVVSRFLADVIPTMDFKQPDWEKNIVLPANVNDAFGEDLNRFDATFKQQVIDLLLPLAYAKGKGLPYKNIWSAVATNIAGRPYTNNDIRHLIENAGYYLIRDIENEEPVYRLFHQAFADYLKRITADEDIDKRFTQALALLRGKNDKGAYSWKETKEPYLLKYFAAHATSAAMLENFLPDIDFLRYYPSANLLPFLPYIQSEEGGNIARAYRRASHWTLATTDLFVSQLMWRCFEYDAKALTKTISDEKETLAWYPTWGQWTMEFSNYVIGATSKYISVFATYQDEELGPVVVAAYNDSSIDLWKLSDGKRLAALSAPDPIPSTSLGIEYPKFVALERLTNDLMIVVGWDSTIAIYESTKGSPIQLKTFDFTITALTLHKESDKLTLVIAGDQTNDKIRSLSLRSLDIPSFHLVGFRMNASNARLYTLGITTYDQKTVLVSSGDSYNNGQRLEPDLVKVWSIPDLQLLWGSGEMSGSYCKQVYSFPVGEQLWIIAILSGEIYLYNTSGHKQLIDQGYASMDCITGFTIKKNVLEFLGYKFSSLFKGTINFTSNPPEVHLARINVAISESRWGEAVLLNNRLTLVSAESGQFRVWDYHEVMSLALPTNKKISAYQLQRGDQYSHLVLTSKNIIVSTAGRKLASFDHAGNFLMEKPFPGQILQMQVATINEVETMILAGDRKITTVDPLTLEKITEFELHGIEDSFSLEVFHLNNSPLALLSVKYRQRGARAHYAARMWDLQTGLEVISSVKDYLDEDLFHIGAWEDKTLLVAKFIHSKLGSWILLAGPDGEVRLKRLDDKQYGYIDECSLTISRYIEEVGVLVKGDKILAAISNEIGELQVRDLVARKFISTGLVKAHKGRVSRVLFHEVNGEYLLVTAGMDQKIHFWNVALQKKYTIDADHAVLDIAFLDRDRMVVLCRTGITTLTFNWDHIL